MNNQEPRKCGQCNKIIEQPRKRQLFCCNQCRMKCHNDARKEIHRKALALGLDQ